MAENIINIGGRLHDTSSNHTVTGANEVLDDDLQKKQNVINAEQQEFNQEQEGINADTYRKNEVYNKEETNNILSRTPETGVFIVDVPAASQSDIATYLDEHLPNDNVPARELVKTALTATKTEDRFINEEGQPQYSPNMDIYTYTDIVPTQKYSSKDFGVPSPAYGTVYFVHYYNGDTYLGYDENIVGVGPYVSGEVYLNPPAACNIIKIHSQHSYVPKTYLNVINYLPNQYVSVRSNKVFRVPGPDNTTYSEWAWDGTKFVMLCEKDYGIDEEATENSQNVITSGAVYDLAPKGNGFIQGEERSGFIRSTTGDIVESSDYEHYYFEVIAGNHYHIHVPSFPQASEFAVGVFISAERTGGYTCTEIPGTSISTATTLDLDVTVPAGTIAIGLNTRESATGAPTLAYKKAVNVEDYVEDYVESQVTPVSNVAKELYKGFWLLENYLVNHPGVSGIPDYLLESPDYDCLVFEIPYNARFVVVRGLERYLWINAFDNYDLESWKDEQEGSAGVYGATTDLLDHPDWKVLIATVKKSDNVGVEYYNVHLEWTYKDVQNANETAISSYTKTQLEGELEEGKFPGFGNGQWVNNANMNSLVFEDIDPQKSYSINGCGLPTSGYTSVAFVHYYNEDGSWLGRDKNTFIEQGPYQQVGDVILEVPNTCYKIIVCSHKDYDFELDELSVGQRINSQDIKQRLESDKTDTDANTVAVSQKTQLTAIDSVNGTLFNADGTLRPFPSGGYNKYSVVGGRKYLYSLRLPANWSLNTMIWLDSNNEVIGYEPVVAGYIEISDGIITAPEGAAYGIQNFNLALKKYFTLKEVGSRISSADLKTAIENIGSVAGKKLKVTKSGNNIYVRTALNASEDIITLYTVNGNGAYTIEATYLGSKEASDDTILSNLIHQMGDSTAPLFITDPAPWHMWAQHGYCIPYVEATHSLTSEDINSVWQDQRGRQYKIGNFSSTYIYLLPIVRETEFAGVYTRDWKSPTGANNPQITSLTHVSGAVHTDTIVTTYKGSTQLRPIMTLVSRKLLADGNPVTDEGTYYCNEFVISETLNCTDPFSVETWFPSPVQREVGAVLTQTFTMCGMSCRYDTVLDMKKSYIFGAYGANQLQHFIPIASMDGYDVYGMMPRAKKGNYAVPYLANNLNRSGEWVLRTADDLWNINKQVDRYITFFSNQTTHDMKIGVASGLSLVKGITVDSRRNEVYHVSQEGDRELLSISPSNSNKSYFKVFVDSYFENAILPASTIANFSTYFSYFDPMANTGQVYWYKDGRDYIVYAHYQEEQTKTAINLPDDMEGLGVTVVDTDGVTLLTDVVDNGKVYVSAVSSNHNYIVLKVG